MGYSVFFSHSLRDGRLASWIADNARAIGVQVYLCERDPRPGQLLAEKVQERIEACDAVIALLTQNGVGSTYVQQEIGYAFGKQKRIIPLVSSGIQVKSLAMLQGVEWLEFDPEKSGASLGRLLEFLANLKSAKERDRAALFAIGGLVLVALASSRDQ